MIKEDYRDSDIAHDTIALIRKLFNGLSFTDYISGLEELDNKYPGLGFAESIHNLVKWKAEKPATTVFLEQGRLEFERKHKLKN